MVNLNSKGICTLALSLIVLTDISIALNIPVLRQVFGFIFLTFLPGFLLVKTLRLPRPPLEKLLFLMGLSVSFLMFIPLLMNFLYPALGISQPISLSPLTVTFSSILAVLTLVAYKKGALDSQITIRDFATVTSGAMNPAVLGAALILALGIFGALFVKYDLNSLFSLFSTLSIVVIVVLVAMSNRVPQRFFPLYILVIAVTLQYSRTLSSPSLTGIDANYELYFADLVKSVGYWNPNFAIASVSQSDYYGMLSVVFLPNVYSILLNIDTVWVFWLISPFIFAFVPLGLYQLYKTQTTLSSRSAFLATFFVMSFYAFFIDMATLTRQEVAELFLVLVTLLIMNWHSQNLKKGALLILFIGSMVVSHYATSYIFLLFLTVLWVGSVLTAPRNRQKRSLSTVSGTMVVLAVCVTFGWYMYAAGGAPYSAFGASVGHVFGSLSSLFSASTNPSVVGGLGGGLQNLSLAHVLGHYWQIITEVLITVGLVLAILRRNPSKMSTPFLFFALGSFGILLIVIVLPAVGGVYNADRAYALALFFLAPCCIMGAAFIIGAASGWLRANENMASKLTSLCLIAVLVPYFLFNYGFIFEVIENPQNYALPPLPQSERVSIYRSNVTWSYLVNGPIPSESVDASAWLSNFKGPALVYSDLISTATLIKNVPADSIRSFSDQNIHDRFNNVYIYLGPANIQQGIIPVTGADAQHVSSFAPLATANRVYSNGLAEVYYSP
jgi:uncharacterized membrane protein